MILPSKSNREYQKSHVGWKTTLVFFGFDQLGKTPYFKCSFSFGVLWWIYVLSTVITRRKNPWNSIWTRANNFWKLSHDYVCVEMWANVTHLVNRFFITTWSFQQETIETCDMSMAYTIFPKFNLQSANTTTLFSPNYCGCRNFKWASRKFDGLFWLFLLWENNTWWV